MEDYKKQVEKIDKLVKYREWLISETERWIERENDKTNSNAGKHYCIGAANTLISARAEFEEIFDYDESWLGKQCEQKPAEILLTLEEAITHCKEKSCGNSACASQHKQLAKWLKELKEYKEQNHTEWSEEDERMLASFLHKVEVCDLLSNKESVWILKKLKSLKPQPHWKPSEEQIKALKWVLANIPYCTHKEEINGLLEHLEQL